MDRAWHVEHFTCNSCSKQIQSFLVHNDQPYCEECYDRSFVEHKVCALCNKAILGTVVSALKNTYHTECFKCTSCHSHFENNEFYQLEGKPWCLSCVQKSQQAKLETCDGCHQPIESRELIKLEGMKYHNNNKCFACKGCQSPFPSLNFYEVQGSAYCHDCAIKLVK
ncbi:hypothetical protein SAMD00019534_120140 [Acytostelium subglobosum LB1]|uniref:hypothetical protein n=1 Tax=Acytostelium subglobosum LB1 TaxID=1410327 RepID=UPI000644CDEA|nr:hypothetical protein SAMD00019534_120140 [Acytostelium subglobosum LB1]GAM28838.1 hypothetical protein SAMD00019534_120140 [Acytostelium subglobosum LB1]|eukprot:XP_012748210.1 hypothetical protein SAMD00019534_120140 [Acytostelium subglobosum LB1]